MLDLMIIGAGPAGLSAAVYAQRAALHARTLEQYTAGGQIASAMHVENYPGIPEISGLDLADQMREHVKALGGEMEMAEVVSLLQRKSEPCWEAVCGDERTVTARSVIVATGTQRRKLNVPGEDKYTGHGVSYCAACDGFFFRGKTAAVIGGGDTAVDDAIHLSSIAKRVYLIHRRDTLRANQRRQEILRRKSNVTMLWNSVVTEICGDGERVNAVHLKQTNGSCPKLLVDGVFIAVGAVPETEYLPPELQRDSEGYIVAGEDGKTNLPGLFVAGDLRTKTLRQAVTAVSDGACAVTSAEQYLQQIQ